MLNKYKNEFIHAIKKNGFDPNQFDAGEKADRHSDCFIMTLRNTPFRFVVQVSPTDFHMFECRCVIYAPHFPEHSPVIGWYKIEVIKSAFDSWLQLHVKAYLDDISVPDLWEQINLQKPLISDSLLDQEDTANFTEEEKTQLRRGMAEFRLLIQETFKPNADQTRLIEDRLTYVSSALDRLNRFDWKSILISALISISIALSLDTARGKILLDLLRRAFMEIKYLLL